MAVLAYYEPMVDLGGFNPDAFAFLLKLKPDFAWKTLLEVEPAVGRAFLEAAGAWDERLPRVAKRSLDYDRVNWVTLGEVVPELSSWGRVAQAVLTAAADDYKLRNRMVLRFLVARFEESGAWAGTFSNHVAPLLKELPALALAEDLQAQVLAWLLDGFACQRSLVQEEALDAVAAAFPGRIDYLALVGERCWPAPLSAEALAGNLCDLFLRMTSHHGVQPLKWFTALDAICVGVRRVHGVATLAHALRLAFAMEPALVFFLQGYLEGDPKGTTPLWAWGWEKVKNARGARHLWQLGVTTGSVCGRTPGEQGVRLFGPPTWSLDEALLASAHDLKVCAACQKKAKALATGKGI